MAQYRDLENHRIWSREHYKQNRERIRAYHNAWAEKNREHLRAYYQQYHINYTKRDKLRIIEHYSPNLECNHCGFNDIRALSIDHKNSDGWKERKDMSGYTLYKSIINNGYPDRYQVLCMNCQFIKRVELGEWRPHGQRYNQVEFNSRRSWEKDRVRHLGVKRTKYPGYTIFIAVSETAIIMSKTVTRGVRADRRRNPKSMMRSERVELSLSKRELKTLRDRARYYHMPLASYVRAASLNWKARK